MRWKQKVNPDGTSRFEPIDESASRLDQSQGKGDFIVRGNFDTFKSPVDGSTIRNHREYEAHNKRNNVVNAAEFSPEYYARKAKEREKVLSGEHTRQESFERKQEIYNKIIQAERNQ